jgi:subtilisin-like proprotein convertase family protein
MDIEQFDRITSKFAAFTSRRQALRFLAAAALGNGGLTFLSQGVSDAKTRKRRKKKPKSVTRTFANVGGITIPAGGAATPYPSTIAVSGFKKGKITDLNLTLHGYNHTRPSDVDVLLVAPDGRNAIVMADVGNGTPITGVTITLNDQAGPFPDLGVNQPLPSGTYQPANNLVGEDPFDGAPTPSGAVALSTFNGSDPNGAWQLYVFDDQGGSSGAFAGGWELTITARVKKKKRKKKKR